MTTVRPEGGEGSIPGGLPWAGLRVVIPGAAQWSWGQRERGAVFFGSFAAGVLTAAFAWGTWTGVALLVFAFAAHVAATTDVIRQNAFPAPGRLAALAGALGGLGLGVYAPVLAVVLLVAWPALRDGTADGYLVNVWAYRRVEPRRDELVWYRPTPAGAPRVGRVVAGRGQEVDWSGGTMKVDGRPDRDRGPLPAAVGPRSLRYRVPEGHVLVRPEGGPVIDRTPFDGLSLVHFDQILGRPWALFYPVRERRLL